MLLDIEPVAPLNTIFDSHAHYDDDIFDDVREDLLQTLPKYGVAYVINNAVDCKESAQKCIGMSHDYDYCYTAIGVHPLNLEDNGPLDTALLTELLKTPKVVAVGEIGLDYHYTPETKPQQLELFEKQLILANELKLPVIVHDREAHADTLELLEKHRPTGVLHCFSGSVEMARDVLNLGMYIGVGGVVTFKNAKKLVEIVKMLPDERLLLETDAPYLTPVPYRGKICNSAYISVTAARIAEIKGYSTDKVLQLALENAKRLYKI